MFASMAWSATSLSIYKPSGWWVISSSEARGKAADHPALQQPLRTLEETLRQQLLGPVAETQQEDDIAAQLGVGSAAADAELDRLKETVEAEIMVSSNLIGRFAKLVSDFCHMRSACLSSEAVVGVTAYVDCAL
jgi:non-canonical (house-cleaning) NTP pyrophosphatase